MLNIIKGCAPVVRQRVPLQRGHALFGGADFARRRYRGTQLYRAEIA